jgi:predicted DNA-binding antitoxin AbrB/MazE fold protein
MVMSQTIEAIYQNGMFKPLNPVSEEIAEGETVEITISEKRLTPEEMLKLASQVYEGLSDEDIAEIERIALDRSNFFGDRKL